MDRKASRRRYPPRRRLRRKPTSTRPSRATIRKNSTKPRGSSGRGLEESSTRAQAAPKPTYFSLLKDVEHALKVDHAEGASMQKLKRKMEKKYGGRSFDVSSCKMLKSAVKRLQNKGRITKNRNSTLLKFKPPVVPAYNFFGSGSSKGVRVTPIRPNGRQTSRAPPIRKHVAARGSISRVPPMRKHLTARASTIRKPAKRSFRPMPSYRPPIRRRRGKEYSESTPAGSGTSSVRSTETQGTEDAVDASTRSSS